MRIIRDELKNIDDADIINGTVYIPEGVTKISSFCFLKSKLEYLVMPDTIDELGSEVFFDCKNLKRVVLSKRIKKFLMDVFKIVLI